MDSTRGATDRRLQIALTWGSILLTLTFGCGEPQTTPTTGGPLGNGEKLYSQHDEELIIRDFFQDRRGGFFVDVGCYDYQDLSTTFYLEKHLGWSGIGIDANQALRADYERYRPRTQFENYVVTDQSGGTQTFYLNVGGEGISSVSRRWIVDFLDTFFPNAQPKIQAVEVPAITLDDLLEQNGVHKIDFLSMDIEGHEPAALAGFDIKKFAPELVCIEAPQDPGPILEYFEQNGYRRIDRYQAFDQVNWYFQPEIQPELSGAP
ncbi:FkbM family methyltransferase [Myxococcota bacterium]|nr:FkbM family methyltransferase [Myxococcota bacterium]